MEHRAAAPAVTKLANKLRRRIFALASRGEVSGAQGRALHFLLAQKEPVVQRDVEEEFGLSPATASGLLKQLEKDGLIRRETDQRDGRCKRIVVDEEAARRLRGEVMRGLDEMDETLKRGIPAEDLETFFRVADKMMENMDTTV